MKRGTLLFHSFVLSMALADARGGERVERRVYTNDDLERVSSRRGETGVQSRPAVPQPAAAASHDSDAQARSREERWRREADRLRQRLQPLRDEADDLREQIGARRMAPGVRPLSDPKLHAWQRRLSLVEARIREAEDRFEERARRAGALPGWLR